MAGVQIAKHGWDLYNSCNVSVQCLGPNGNQTLCLQRRKWNFDTDSVLCKV